MSKWKKVRLGDYIHEYSERNKENADIPVFSVTNSNGFCTEYFSKEVASKDKTTYKIVKKGFFAYNPSRINVGSVDWLRDKNEVIVSPLYNVFSVDDGIDQQYLYYYLKSPIGLYYIKELASGSVRDNLKFSILSEFRIPLPEIKLQKEVAKTLDRIVEIISICNTILETLDLLVKSRFVEMFGGIHDSQLYPYKKVKEFTDVISGGTPSRDVKDYWENGNISWVKTTELQNTIITNTEEYITEKGLSESSAKVVPPETVLIAMYGQGKTRGMTGYLKITATTNQACACILPSKSINSMYLWKYFILSYDDLRNLAKGGNQPNLNGNIIKNYPVLFPPLDLQNQFADFVAQTDKSKLAVKQVLEKAETLKKALMQEYFG